MKTLSSIKSKSVTEKIIIGLAVILLLGLIAHAVCELFFEGGNKANAQQRLVAPVYDYKCPAGSYPIGDGACKSDPTGCAYGDSIPADSPKCAPAEEPTAEAPVDETPTTTTPAPATTTQKAGGSCTL